MDKRDLLIQRINEIGDSLKNSKKALALLGLGSCGTEKERLDEYSDLDFFVIVKEGYKQEYINNLNWLETICKVGFKYKNTTCGYKVLFLDGVFCEFAVFEPKELQNVPFSVGKLVWKDETFDENLCIPRNEIEPLPKVIDVEWTIGEALTNIYVGMGRYQRGEKLSAYRFVQIYAVDQIVDLISILEEEQNDFKDNFDNSRRIENRYPNMSKEFPKFIQGYDRTPESAQAILNFLDVYFEVNECIKHNILYLTNHFRERIK